MCCCIDAAEQLEEAVINSDPDELRALYKKIGYVEFSARALGYACRFRGVDTVRALCECGATFHIPKEEAVESRYHVYSGVKYGNYRSNFALYLLNIPKQIKGSCCCKGLKFLKQIERTDKKKLKPIYDDERAEVLKYLCGNSGKLSFDPSELLFFAIFARDDLIYNELKKLGVRISEKRISIMANGGYMSDMYWFEYVSLTSKMSDEDYLPVMEKLAAELDGKQFHCTEKIFETAKNRFSDYAVTEFFFEKFNMEKLNKTNILRGMIDGGRTAALPLAEKAGWLESTRRRDELIDYARKNKQTECTAWLLDFKNRTADLAAERAKIEKRINAEMNASPGSVMMLRKIWSFRKCADSKELALFGEPSGIGDGLVITSYKDDKPEVTVPETIGRSVVRAIGVGAFSANSGACGGLVRSSASYQGQNARRKIRRIVLPNTVKIIMGSAFAEMPALEEIDIPEGVEIIDICTFYNDSGLKKVSLPSSLRSIMMYAFANCGGLRELVIPEGVGYVGVGAFSNCVSLKKLVLPRSLTRIDTSAEGYKHFNRLITDGCPDCEVYFHKGSYAERYCREHGIRSKAI